MTKSGMEAMAEEMIFKGEITDRIVSALYSCRHALDKEQDNWEHILSQHVIPDLEYALEAIGILKTTNDDK